MLVSVNNNTPTTTSKIIADGIGIQHKNVIALIESHHSDLSRVSAFETRKVKIESKLGRPSLSYHLDESQAALLITMMKNTKKAMDFKVSLINEFYRMRESLKSSSNTLNEAYKDFNQYKDKAAAWAEFGRVLSKQKPLVLAQVEAAENLAQLKLCLQ